MNLDITVGNVAQSSGKLSKGCTQCPSDVSLQRTGAEHLCSNYQSHWWTVVPRGLQFLHTPGQGLSKTTGRQRKSEAEKGRNYVGIWDEILAACPATIIVTKIWGGWRVCEAGHTQKCRLTQRSKVICLWHHLYRIQFEGCPLDLSNMLTILVLCKARLKCIFPDPLLSSPTCYPESHINTEWCLCFCSLLFLMLQDLVTIFICLCSFPLLTASVPQLYML